MTESELFFYNIEDLGYSISDLGFSAGASEDQVTTTENAIGRLLPDEFRQFLKCANGQNADKFYFLPDEALMFSCTEIADEYEAQKDHFNDTLEFYNEFQYKDKVRCTVWSESRVPIAGRDGYYLFLDFDPGPNGTVGQVIYLINECDMVVLGSDFKAFVESYNILIRNKILRVNKTSSGQTENYRLTSGKDFLDGQDFVKLFGL